MLPDVSWGPAQAFSKLRYTILGGKVIYSEQ
jgi:hypothetical protein